MARRARPWIQRKYSRAGGRRRQADAVARHAARGGLRGCGLRASRRSASPRPGPTSLPATCTSTSWRARRCAGADAAGGKGVLFNTITVSDGISMGSPGHALFAGVARGDRRLHRDRGGRRGLRRLRGHRRLRQEHARLRHGHRAPESPGGVRLRRHHPPGREAARHRLGVRGGRRACGRHASRMRNCSKSSAPRSPVPAAAAACTPPTPWPRRSKRWACRCPTAPRRRRSGSAKRDDCRRAGAAVVRAGARRHHARATSSRARRSRTPSP